VRFFNQRRYEIRRAERDVGHGCSDWVFWIYFINVSLLDSTCLIYFPDCWILSIGFGKSSSEFPFARRNFAEISLILEWKPMSHFQFRYFPSHFTAHRKPVRRPQIAFQSIRSIPMARERWTSRILGGISLIFGRHANGGWREINRCRERRLGKKARKSTRNAKSTKPLSIQQSNQHRHSSTAHHPVGLSRPSFFAKEVLLMRSINAGGIMDCPTIHVCKKVINLKMAQIISRSARVGQRYQ
jgi:hypothetical protein